MEATLQTRDLFRGVPNARIWNATNITDKAILTSRHHYTFKSPRAGHPRFCIHSFTLLSLARVLPSFDPLSLSSSRSTPSTSVAILESPRFWKKTTIIAVNSPQIGDPVRSSQPSCRYPLFLWRAPFLLLSNRRTAGKLPHPPPNQDWSSRSHPTSPKPEQEEVLFFWPTFILTPATSAGGALAILSRRSCLPPSASHRPSPLLPHLLSHHRENHSQTLTPNLLPPLLLLSSSPPLLPALSFP